MASIGGVEYDEAGFDLMRSLYALAQSELDGDLDAAVVREAECVHEIYRHFPGVRLVAGDDHGACAESPTGQSPTTARPSPDENRVGKFQRPGDASATQREAAIMVMPRTGTARRAVLDHIAAAGNPGVTDEEVQDALAMNPSTQRPRRVELVEGGWIRDSGRTRVTRSGTRAVVWVLARQEPAQS